MDLHLQSWMKQPTKVQIFFIWPCRKTTDWWRGYKEKTQEAFQTWLQNKTEAKVGFPIIFCTLFPQGCKLEQENDRLYLPKIGWVRYRNSCEMVDEVRNVCFYFGIPNSRLYSLLQ